jgi:hypothetical protein
MVRDLREWLDAIAESFGPKFEVEVYAFVMALEFPDDGTGPGSAVATWCSDTRHWAKIGLLRQALISFESEVE